MNTRNSHGLYDAPNHTAVREPLALTQDELRRQLEAGAFVMDRDEAVEGGLINAYDDETDTVLVKEEQHEPSA